MTNSGFWNGKTVFMTGHTGFQGGWLSLWLTSLGARVVGYALAPPTTPSLFEVADVEAALEASIIADVRDRDVLASAMHKAQPEIVFHLAAQPLVRLSYAEPVDTFMTNVMGTVNVLESARSVSPVRAIVVITSDKCYENPEWVWACRETDPMGGHDPYSASKGCTELVTSSYRRSFYAAGNGGKRVGIGTARAGNVIGGGDWALDRLIPDAVRAIEQGKPVSIRNPDAVRPWQHVLEPLSGYIRLAQALWDDPIKHAEGWNFGPQDRDALPVRDVVDRFCRQIGRGASWQHEPVANAPHEAHLLRLDIAKARALLGWEPRWSLAEGLEKTADWYGAFLDGSNMPAITRAQIAAFQSAQGGGTPMTVKSAVVGS